MCIIILTVQILNVFSPSLISKTYRNDYGTRTYSFLGKKWIEQYFGVSWAWIYHQFMLAPEFLFIRFWGNSLVVSGKSLYWDYGSLPHLQIPCGFTTGHLAVWPWPVYLTVLSFGFLISKVGTLKTSPERLMWGLMTSDIMNSLAHCGHLASDSCYFPSHHEQFGWKVGSERDVPMELNQSYYRKSLLP